MGAMEGAPSVFRTPLTNAAASSEGLGPVESLATHGDDGRGPAAAAAAAEASAGAAAASAGGAGAGGTRDLGWADRGARGCSVRAGAGPVDDGGGARRAWTRETILRTWKGFATPSSVISAEVRSASMSPARGRADRGQSDTSGRRKSAAPTGALMARRCTKLPAIYRLIWYTGSTGRAVAQHDRLGRAICYRRQTLKSLGGPSTMWHSRIIPRDGMSLSETTQVQQLPLCAANGLLIGSVKRKMTIRKVGVNRAPSTALDANAFASSPRSMLCSQVPTWETVHLRMSLPAAILAGLQRPNDYADAPQAAFHELTRREAG